MISWLCLPFLLFIRLVSRIFFQIMSIRLVGQVRTTAGPNNDVTLDERFTALCKLADNPAFTLAEIVV